VHAAVDTVGHLLALTVTPADRGDREQVDALAAQVQQVLKWQEHSLRHLEYPAFLTSCFDGNSGSRSVL
jgi:hypothetical protein